MSDAPGPRRFDDADALARLLIDRTGGRIRLALPLGLGKACTIANALTRAALADRSIQLSIFTALTLEPPAPSGDMERRFLEPALDRLFGRYPALLYAGLLRSGELPENIQINEFFLLAGRWLGVERMQQSYVSINYSQAFAVLIDRRPNVVAQLLARDGAGRLSLGGNTDLTLDLLAARRQGRADFHFSGEVNTELPFMDGSAVPGEDEVDLLLDSPDTDFELFSVPKRPVGRAEHAIGLNVARLVRDGGTLQIGIGSIGDAIAHALVMRHARNGDFRDLVAALPCDLPADAGDDGPFETGLYAATEMLVDGLLQLFEAGVIRREVDGAAIHAGFFVDTRDFYRRLREMPPERRARIAMTAVSFTNTLYGDEAAKRAARRDARFINNAMNVTLLGAAASDTLPDGRVVSGVGGQFDFVAQAFALDDARSIIALRATRQADGRPLSNILWSHAQATIPRHLRDIVVTEYGIADLRWKSDADCIAAMLAVTDSRFQDELVEQARQAGKIARDFRLPDAQRQNTPERLRERLDSVGDTLLPKFPFGTDFTETEQRLMPALAALKRNARSGIGLARLAWAGLTGNGPGPAERECLARMSLEHPSGAKERLLRLALLGALAASGGSRR